MLRCDHDESGYQQCLCHSAPGNCAVSSEAAAQGLTHRSLAAKNTMVLASKQRLGKHHVVCVSYTKDAAKFYAVCTVVESGQQQHFGAKHVWCQQ